MASNVLALQHSMHGTARPKPLACIIMVKLSVLFTSFEIDCAILLFRSMPVQSQLPSYTYKLINRYWSSGAHAHAQRCDSRLTHKQHISTLCFFLFARFLQTQRNQNRKLFLLNIFGSVRCEEDEPKRPI